MSDGDALRAALGQLRDLLARSSDGNWAMTVSNAPKNADDSALAETVLAWFADAEAPNALVLSPASGDLVPSCAVDALNRAFVSLRGEAFRLARAIAVDR